MTHSTITVQVLHNAQLDGQDRHLGMLNGYRNGDRLIHVADLQVRNTGNVNQLLDVVFTILNVGEDPAFGPVNPQAVRYRTRRNRSLSTGDVVVIDGVAFAVASFGFDRVRVAPEQVHRDRAIGGSTGLDTVPAD